MQDGSPAAIALLIDLAEQLPFAGAKGEGLQRHGW
jgi:hypothetical protein